MRTRSKFNGISCECIRLSSGFLVDRVAVLLEICFVSFLNYFCARGLAAV